MQPALEEMTGPHLEVAELEIFPRRKKDAASEDMAEVMTTNSLQGKNSRLPSASAIVDGKFPPALHNKTEGRESGPVNRTQSSTMIPAVGHLFLIGGLTELMCRRHHLETGLFS